MNAPLQASLPELSVDIAAAARSEDLREGQAAWAGKRTPRFTG